MMPARSVGRRCETPGFREPRNDLRLPVPRLLVSWPQAENVGGLIRGSDRPPGLGTEFNCFRDQLGVRRCASAGEELESEVQMPTRVKSRYGDLARDHVPANDRHRPRQIAAIEQLEVCRERGARRGKAER